MLFTCYLDPYPRGSVYSFLKLDPDLHSLKRLDSDTHKSMRIRYTGFTNFLYTGTFSGIIRNPGSFYTFASFSFLKLSSI
jgi:hypothetical protein